jgi:enamine deaminase RidA (YjgF/YER057c/UK114 family)
MLKLNSNERMSQIVIHNQTIYLSGQVGAVDEDVSAQTLTCLNKAKNLLEEVGSDKSKMLSATVWRVHLGAPRFIGGNHHNCR